LILFTDHWITRPKPQFSAYFKIESKVVNPQKQKGVNDHELFAIKFMPQLLLFISFLLKRLLGENQCNLILWLVLSSCHFHEHFGVL